MLINSIFLLNYFFLRLRWYDNNGNILKTGQEKAEQEKIRADVSENKMMAEKNRAEKERIRAEQEKMRAEKERIRAENAEKELALLKVKLSLLNK